MKRNVEYTIVEKCKGKYAVDGYIDLMINPELFCEELGLYCTCLKDDDTLDRVARKLFNHGIRVMKYSDGIIRIEDERHHKSRRMKIAGFWITIIAIITCYIIVLL